MHSRNRAPAAPPEPPGPASSPPCWPARAHAQNTTLLHRQADHPAAARHERQRRQPADEHDRHARRQVRHRQRHGLPPEAVRHQHDRRRGVSVADARQPDPGHQPGRPLLRPGRQGQRRRHLHPLRLARRRHQHRRPQPGIGIYRSPPTASSPRPATSSCATATSPPAWPWTAAAYLYAANNEYFALQSTATQAATDAVENVIAPGEFVIYDTNAANAEINRVTLGSADFSSFPLAVAAVGTKVYVTSQRDGAVYVVTRPRRPQTPTATPICDRRAPGGHPRRRHHAVRLQRSQRHDLRHGHDAGKITGTISVRPDRSCLTPPSRPPSRHSRRQPARHDPVARTAAPCTPRWAT